MPLNILIETLALNNQFQECLPALVLILFLKLTRKDQKLLKEPAVVTTLIEESQKTKFKEIIIPL